MGREKIENHAKSILNDLSRDYGCVVNKDEELSYVTPIHKENNLQFAITDNGINGKDISNSLKNLLIQKGYDEPFEESTLIDIRNTLCFVSEDLDREFREYKKDHLKVAGREERYYLNSDFYLSFSHLERAIACESLFRDPFLQGDISSGREKLQKIILDTISKVDSNIQMVLYENIILSGTVSHLKGLKKRLLKEISLILPIEGNPPRRKFSNITITIKKI